MQVSQIEDSITHAVIGQSESVSMGVSDSAALMHILSSTLYTFPKLAMVRETMCNGWDAHISAGKTDTALEVTLSQTALVIQDFGFGIPHNKIGEIYGVYGNSTKRDDSTTTGGFGLGSKSPFAYTDNFEVISCHEGVKTIYRISKSSAEKGGKPAINTIISVPTTETGITVTIAINEKDMSEFSNLINEVVQLGEIRIRLNRALINLNYPLEASPTGYIVHAMRGTIMSTINLRYGNVVYPIPNHVSYQARYDALINLMGRLRNSSSITFMAPADSISIAPSREAIILTDKTVQTVSELLGMFDDNRDFDRAKVATDMICRGIVNTKLAEYSREKIIEDVKAGRDMRPGEDDLRTSVGLYSYTLKQASLQVAMQNKYSMIDKAELQKKQIKALTKKGFLPVKAGEELIKKLTYDVNTRHRSRNGQGTLTTWAHKYIGAPLLQHFRTSETMRKERLFYVNGDYFDSVDVVKYAGMHVDSLKEALSFFNKRVVIAKSRASAERYIADEFPRYSRNGTMIYIVPTMKPEPQAEAFGLFADLGYEVHDHFPVKEKEEKTIDPNAPAKEAVVRKPKRKGYLTLASSVGRGVSSSKTYLITTAREKEDLVGITEPMAYVVLDNKSDGGGRSFAYFTYVQCEVIAKMWGDKIAVVTTTQAEKLKEQGVREIREYVNTHVDEALSKRPDFPRYLAFASKFQDRSDYNDRCKFLRYICNNKNIMDALGLRFHISNETEMLLTFFNNEYSSRNVDMPKCKELSTKVKQSPLVKVIGNKYKNSLWQDFIKMNYLSELIRSEGSKIAPERSKVAEFLAIKILTEEVPIECRK